MKLHEYQAKNLLRANGIPVPAGEVCSAPTHIPTICGQLGYPVAVKAQVLSGGRGKAGGIRLATNEEEAKQAARSILGMNLQTVQSGDRDIKVSKILVEQGVDIERELYLSILPDRAQAQIMILASTAGGMDIEQVAAEQPGSMVKVLVDPLAGLQPHHAREVAFGLRLSGALFQDFLTLLERLYQLVTNNDLLLLEINPLVITMEQKFQALDAKIEVDDNALFRHPELAAWRNSEEEDPLEQEARRHRLNYIRLNGSVGTMVNGAGLAMATMDLIKRAGAEPANFLDVGGGADSHTIAQGFRIILRDPSVNLIFINIFGGILRCDDLARGIVDAASQVEISVPVVIRMEGTNVEQGRKILRESGLALIAADDLATAVRETAERAKNS